MAVLLSFIDFSDTPDKRFGYQIFGVETNLYY